MRKCDYCGREGGVPHVRGAKSAAVSIGNYRAQADVDVTICEACADELMRDAVARLVDALSRGGAK